MQRQHAKATQYAILHRFKTTVIPKDLIPFSFSSRKAGKVGGGGMVDGGGREEGEREGEGGREGEREKNEVRSRGRWR